ncbi:unnamed protein product [Staurois parvus]|uniref:Uncharacterized protein n=1 Tax=Staurois parvus TaxID=386267 RepID=A0ABN9FVM5_9NEOB|nr:unnamed protein product [Staurois parvus]
MFPRAYSVTKPATVKSCIWSPTVDRTWKCNYFSKYKWQNTLTFFSYQQLEQSPSISVQQSTG